MNRPPWGRPLASLRLRAYRREARAWYADRAGSVAEERRKRMPTADGPTRWRTREPRERMPTAGLPTRWPARERRKRRLGRDGR